LIHVSEISKEKVKTPVGMFNVGAPVKAMVINVSADDRKIGLSLKALEDDGDETGSTETKKVGQQPSVQSSGPSTFGDLLKQAAGQAGDNKEEVE
jgi:small subunit ribosomal protein S1